MSRPCHRTQKITFPVCYRQHKAMVLYYHVGFRSCVQKSLLGMHTDRQFQLGSRGKKKKRSWKRDCINKFGCESLFPGELECFGLVLLRVKMQSSLHSKDSTKSETEHVAMRYCQTDMKISIFCDFAQKIQWNLLAGFVHLNRKVRDFAGRRLSLDHTW